MHYRRRLLIVASFALLAATVQAGVPALVNERGWKPLVSLAGQGDTTVAVPALHKAADAVGTVLNGLDIDAETQSFLDEFRASLASFDLEEFYGTLPEQDGDWRLIRISAERQGDTYPVRRVPKGVRRVVSTTGPFGTSPGDLAAAIRSRPVDLEDSGSNYMVKLRAGLGIGQVGWEDLTAFFAESARLVATGDTRYGTSPKDMKLRGSPQTRIKIVETHPHLRHEDIEVLALLWDAFPQMGDVIHRIGRVEDVLVWDPKGDGSYQQVRLSGRLRADLMEEDYPEFSEFLEGIGGLINFQTTWVDEKNRQLARLGFASADLQLTFECFVKDGELLPVENGKVLTSQPEREEGSTRKLVARVDIQSLMNGIQARVHGMKMDWAYTPGAQGMDVEAAFQTVPKVSVSGRAFGILPTWAIDVMIPGNIDELTREFLEVACHGNEGKGITFAFRARQAKDGGPGVFGVEIGLEALNSTLISLAMQIASQKLLPDAEVRGDIHKLLLALHEAFVSDLERFEKLGG